MFKESGFMQHLLPSLKVFGYYVFSVVIGIFMAGSFVEVFANNPLWFILYCIAFLLMFTLIAYSEMFNLSQRDMRNSKSGNITVYKLKGLVIGTIAAIPLAVMTILYLANNWELNNGLKIAYRIVIGLFMAFHIYFVNSYPTVIYVLIIAFTPVVCMLGYLAGYNKFYVSKYFAKLFPPPAKKPAPKNKR